MKLPVNRESEIPIGAYQVWHREGSEFHQVGSLKVPNLLAAAEVAMNRRPAHWMDEGENGRVPLEARQSRPGDVIVSPGGDAFKIVATSYGFTFEPANLDQLRQGAAMLAEQREDAMVGIADGLRAGGTFKNVMRDAATFGIKPAEVAAIRDKLTKEHENEGMER